MCERAREGERPERRNEDNEGKGEKQGGIHTVGRTEKYTGCQ